jgi:paraquat-inducible protein B
MRATPHAPIERAKANGFLPSATIKKSRLSWIIWLIPVGAAALCVWFFYRDYVATGPLITIYFKSADGLQAQNTQVTYRGANVGQVKEVALTTDTQSVRVRARLAGSARNLARAGSVFWIVRPEVKVGAVSGLGTIVSGEYIAVQPGTGAPTNVFVGVEEQPIAEEPNALEITFTSDKLDSLQEQSPIFYRGVQVGEVDYFQLGPDSREVVIHGRVWQQYAPLVRMDTKFWNAGGLDFHLGLFKGMQISAISPRTVISGGIEFATPPDFQAPATNGTEFVLNERSEDKWKAWAPIIPLRLPAEALSTNMPATPYLK